MTDLTSDPLRFANAIVDASTALGEELDPMALLSAASTVREIAPRLCAHLEAKALRAFRIRAMLERAVTGELDEV